MANNQIEINLLLVGLAAPQIGISKRIVLVDVSAQGKGNVGDLRVYINPTITWSSKKEQEWYEGCFSTDRVCGIVSRPKIVRITAWTQDAKQVNEKHEGYTARIFQKDDRKLHWVEEDEFPEYRNNEEWRNWAKKCPRKKWERIKGM